MCCTVSATLENAKQSKYSNFTGDKINEAKKKYWLLSRGNTEAHKFF